MLRTFGVTESYLIVLERIEEPSLTNLSGVCFTSGLTPKTNHSFLLI